MNQNDFDALKNLPREKQQLLLNTMKAELLQDEKKRLALEGKKPIRFFEAFEKQQEFQRQPHQIRAVSGGNGSGKTVIGVAESLYRVTKTHPFDSKWNARPDPMFIMLLVEDKKQAKQPGAAQSVLLSMLPEYIDHKRDITYDKKDEVDTITFPDGGKIFLRSSKAGRESLQGSRIHGVHIDESCMKDANFFDEVLIRLTPYGPPLIWITATPNLDPEKDDTFFEDVILTRCEDEDAWFDWGLTQISLWDNPHIPEETKHFLLQNLTGEEDQINARMTGDYKARAGLVWGQFSPRVHVIPPVSKAYLKENALAIFRVIDPHPVKPIAVAFYACMSDGTVIQFNELNDKGQVGDVARRMRAVCDGLGHLIRATIMDYSGNTSNANMKAGKSFRDEFKEYGISVINCIKDTSLGVKNVRKLLNYTDEISPAFKVTSNCTHTIKEFPKYRIDPKTQLPKKKKKDDEFMDTLRYFAVEPLVKRYLLDRGLDNGKVVKKAGGYRKINEGQRTTSARSSAASRLRKRREANERLLGYGVGR